MVCASDGWYGVFLYLMTLILIEMLLHISAQVPFTKVGPSCILLLKLRRRPSQWRCLIYLT